MFSVVSEGKGAKCRLTINNWKPICHPYFCIFLHCICLQDAAHHVGVVPSLFSIQMFFLSRRHRVQVWCACNHVSIELMLIPSSVK